MKEAGAILHLQTRRAAVAAFFGTEEHETITNLRVWQRGLQVQTAAFESPFSVKITDEIESKDRSSSV